MCKYDLHHLTFSIPLWLYFISLRETIPTYFPHKCVVLTCEAQLKYSHLKSLQINRPLITALMQQFFWGAQHPAWSPQTFNPWRCAAAWGRPRRGGEAAFPAFPITETLAGSEQQLIWQAKMMPIHIQPASVAQGKYFPKLSLNRRIIFEQLRGETGQEWGGEEQGEDLNPLCIHAIHIHKVSGETGDSDVIWSSSPEAPRMRVSHYCGFEWEIWEFTYVLFKPPQIN